MLNPRQLRPASKVFDAKAATGVTGAIDVAEHQHVVVEVSAALNSSLTFKFSGSNQETAPTFSSAQAVANIWDYIGVYDLQDGSFIAGDTGITLNNDTVANNTRRYLINTDYLKWLNIEVTSYTDGSLTAWVSAASAA